MQNDFAAEPAPRIRRPPPLDRSSVLRAVALGILLAAAISGILLLGEYLPAGRVILNENDVSPEDVLAPADKTFFSNVLTERARANRAKDVPNVYDPPDPSIASQQVGRAQDILAYINTVRQDAYAPPEDRARWIAAIPELNLSSETITRMLTMSDEDWQEVGGETEDVLLRIMEEEIREGEEDSVRRELPNRISLRLDFAQRDVVQSLAGGLVKANAFYNAAKTEQAKQEARAAAERVSVTIREGEAIVRAGDIVTSEDIEALNAFGLRQQETKWESIVGNVLFSLIVVLILELLILRLYPALWKRARSSVATVLLIVLFVAMARLMLAVDDDVIPYLFPLPALSMILTVFFGPALGIASGLTVGFVGTFVTDGSLGMAVYVMAGTLIGALTVGRGETLKAFLWAGLIVALTNGTVIMLFGLLSPEQDIIKAAISALVGIVMGGLAASLALAAFFALSALLDVVTPFQLMELSRPTHPLFRRLLLKAPGTYHHTLLLSNMAEEAANRIGANGMLARVGSYYHDVGKTMRPYFFTENQVGSVNPHERLDPRTSAQIIISHVQDGLDLADKYGLPSAVRAFIPEHHGTGLVLAFYRTAVRDAGEDGDSVREEDYRYPGPKPQSKETAVVMLADSSEARVRSAGPESAEEMDRIIRDTIGNRLDSGQLSGADLTLRDLDQIREAFLNVLQGVFHPRVRYPEPVKVKEPDGHEIVR